MLRGLTALDEVPGAKTPEWPSQTEVAEWLGITRARVGQLLQKARESWAKSKALNGLRDEIVRILEAAGGVMSAAELTRAVLSARGSSRVEPARSVFARAVTRAAIEAERERVEPRFFVRRAGECVLVARTLELADYAERLGRVADELATTDPLPGPARVREALERVRAPEGAALDSARLVRLAAAAAAEAAVSSRLELEPWLLQWHNDVHPEYGVGMGDYFRDFVREEARALGVTIEQIRGWEPASRSPARRRNQR
jgi:predicted transcriptional regulator